MSKPKLNKGKVISTYLHPKFDKIWSLISTYLKVLHPKIQEELPITINMFSTVII
jgi:hypothetical protein